MPLDRRHRDADQPAAASTTGPPLLPGLSAPSIWTMATFPDRRVRMLETDPLADRDRRVAPARRRASRRTGSRRCRRGIVSTSSGVAEKSTGFGAPLTPLTFRMARSRWGRWRRTPR